MHIIKCQKYLYIFRLYNRQSNTIKYNIMFTHTYYKKHTTVKISAFHRPTLTLLQKLNNEVTTIVLGKVTRL